MKDVSKHRVPLAAATNAPSRHTQSLTRPPGRPNWTSCGFEKAHTHRGRRHRHGPPSGSDDRGRHIDASGRRPWGGPVHRDLRGPVTVVHVVPHVAHWQTCRRAVRGLHIRTPATCSNCPTCTPATSPSQCSARVRSTRATGTERSWGGRCRGTPCLRRPWTESLPGAISG